jgi:hypothetical protein
MYPSIGSAATYQIRVIGQIDENWATRLGGLTIITTKEVDQQVITSLQGDLVDQAALFGVLMTLYDLRLPLLSVECLNNNLTKTSNSTR